MEKVLSGGQTGVDRAALDAATRSSFPCGGWGPRGRNAEDGPIHADYPLRETPSRDYTQRTEWNVRDSDATLILTVGRIRGGTALTWSLARRMGKPRLVIDLDGDGDVPSVIEWLEDNDVSLLNVAGPRESQRPGIYDKALAFVSDLLDALQTTT